jgi:hypothetical protein
VDIIFAGALNRAIDDAGVSGLPERAIEACHCPGTFFGLLTVL